jgi:hypothetical protein
MIKWIKCFFLGHTWIEKGKTTQYLHVNGRHVITVNYILSRCEHCGKYKEYQTKAFYENI